MTVKELQEKLAEFPPDASVHAYEGEMIGLAIRWHEDRAAPMGIREIHGFIETPCE